MNLPGYVRLRHGELPDRQPIYHVDTTIGKVLAVR